MQAQGKRSAGEGDGKQRFLADLRSLRDTAALEFDELAARAHYPSDVLKEAETGPALPTLPILAAYVRACEGDVPEWEERWRRLGAETDIDPGLPVRPAGASPAAVAGARAGVSVAPPDAYDPDRIRAALRGSHGGSGQAARGKAFSRRDAASRATTEPKVPGVPESPVSWSSGTNWDETTSWDTGRSAETATGWGAEPQPDAAATSWDGFRREAGTGWDGFQPDAGPRWDGVAADLSDPPANGNHHVSRADNAAADTAVIQPPDAAQAEALRRDPFSADWLRDSELTPAPEPEWQAESSPEAWFSPPEPTAGERTWADAETGTPAADNWFTPREPAADGLTSTESDLETPTEHTGPTGFWTPSAAASVPAAGPVSGPAEVRRPDPPSAHDRTIPLAGWLGTAETPASKAPTSVAAASVAAASAAPTSVAPTSVAPTSVAAASVAAAGAAPTSVTPTSVAPASEAPTARAPASIAPASIAAASVAPAADRATPVLAPSATASRAVGSPGVPPGPVVPPSARRSDRLYMVRLLVVIVVAALIGSVLVLLVR